MRGKPNADIDSYYVDLVNSCRAPSVPICLVHQNEPRYGMDRVGSINKVVVVDDKKVQGLIAS